MTKVERQQQDVMVVALNASVYRVHWKDRQVRLSLGATEREGRMDKTHRERFDIEPGSLPDMICGNNGEKFKQVFGRTLYIDVYVSNVLD
jgi:hypothetical protein